MRTKSIKKNKINVVTLGCSKNIYDSEVLMGQLKANGKDVVHEDKNDEGNIVVINTCGFIGKAKEESIDTILHYVEKKELGDVLWYLSALADNLDMKLSTIAKKNIEKLKDRKNRGVIKGSGDNR